MPAARTVFRWAMVAYATSFGLVAVVSPGPTSVPGFMCAYVTLVGPLVNSDFFSGKAAHYVPFLISGWVNVVFLASIGTRWRIGEGRAFQILRAATLLMIPFCWIVIYGGGFHPREGHVLWIASMAVALFAAPAVAALDDGGFASIADTERQAR